MATARATTLSQLRRCNTLLDVEDAIGAGGLLRLQEADGYVVDWNSGGGLAVGGSVMGMAVDDQVGAVAIDYFGQSRGAEEREDFGISPLTVAAIGE